MKTQLDDDAVLRHNGYDASRLHWTAAQRAYVAAPLKFAPSSVSAAPLPVNGFDLNIFYTLVQDVFPVFFILTFLYTQKKVINELVHEKESKVRETLRMMGVGSATLFGAWYLTYALIFGLLCAVFTLTAGVRIFEYSANSVVWVFFWLWCMSFVAFAFAIHTLFDKSRTGGIVGMIASFGQWVLFTGITAKLTPGTSTMLALGLFPNCAFCQGVKLLGVFESSKVGVQWSNLTMQVRE